ncbi:hypothetical protein ES703_75912 [subsurface metagenome]
MKEKDDYIKQLEDTIAKFMAPLEDIPFPIAIKFLFQYKLV